MKRCLNTQSFVTKLASQLEQLFTKIPTISKNSKSIICAQFELEIGWKEIIDCVQIYPKFIFSTPSKNIASFGNIRMKEVTGSHRFMKINKFLESVSTNIELTGSYSPYILGGFSFFDTIKSLNWKYFKPATFVMGKYQFIRENEITSLLLLVENSENIENELIQNLKTLISSLRLQDPLSLNIEYTNSINFDEWKNRLSEVQNQIEKCSVKKVVLARTVIGQHSSISTISTNLFQSLMKTQKGCYIFHFEPFKGEIFVGATPELLIATKSGKLQSMALAGSAPRGESIEDDKEFVEKLLFSDKNLREHRIVVNKILNRLENVVTGIQYTQNPLILKLSNIQHLLTEISALLPPDLSIIDIIKKLHPTPAVGGEPDLEAMKIIEEYENFRGWYAAPLGIIDAKGNSEFVVALRSAHISADKISLFAGAGLVAGSDPMSEWEETEIKFLTIKEALKNL